MRRLSPRVNVIPVIGKSDTLTPSELAAFKRRVMEDIEHYEIPVYNFPYDVEEDDEETIVENSELRALLPFAIVGSEEEVEVNGEMVRARRYPWGLVEVDNPQHSDFQRLRSALLQTHLADMKVSSRLARLSCSADASCFPQEIMHDYLYENYRTEKLSRSVQGADGYPSESSILPEEFATQSVRLKEEQLRREGKWHLADLPSRAYILSYRGEASRGRAQGTARAVGEAPGAAGQGGVATQPRDASQCSASFRAGLSQRQRPLDGGVWHVPSVLTTRSPRTLYPLLFTFSPSSHEPLQRLSPPDYSARVNSSYVHNQGPNRGELTEKRLRLRFDHADNEVSAEQ